VSPNIDTLVTVFGGSGFIGRHTIRALAKRDFRIRVRSTDTCIYAEDGNDQDYDDIVLCFYPAASGGEQLDRPAPPPPP